MPRAYPNHPIPAAVAEKYATRFEVAESGCWISVYAPMPHGYAGASWRVEGRSISSTAHRAAWTHHNGPIPDGMTIDHICKTRNCVNPAHLRLLTLADNSGRKGRDWPLGQCAWGHAESSMKRYVWSGQERSACGDCMKERNDYTTALKASLRLLEITYGLGDWHTKGKYYERALAERASRVDARRAEREAGQATQDAGT